MTTLSFLIIIIFFFLYEQMKLKINKKNYLDFIFRELLFLLLSCLSF